MLTILTLLLPLFGLIAIGYIAGRAKIAQLSWVSTLNLFSYYIAFPALILKSLAFTDLDISQQGPILLVQFVFSCSLILLTYGVGRWLGLPRTDRNTYMIGVYFSLAGYIGIPALQLVFGDTAAAEGALIVAVMIAVTLSLGVGLLESSRSNQVHLKKIVLNVLKNPLLITTVIGIIIGSTQLTIPAAVAQLITMVAAAASPTVLVALGIFIAWNHPKRHAMRIAIKLTTLKLIVIPGVMGLVIWFLPDSHWLDTTFIQACMPVAITTFALAEIYPMDKQAVSSSIVVSTLLSVVIIPLAMWLAPKL
jgi:predicted permease